MARPRTAVTRPESSDGYQHGNCLRHELMEAPAIEEASALAVDRQGNEAKRQRADESAAQVDAHDVEGVVKAEPVLEVHEHAQRAPATRPSPRAASGADVGAGGGDGHESGNHARGRPREVGWPWRIFSVTSQLSIAAAGAPEC